MAQFICGPLDGTELIPPAGASRHVFARNPTSEFWYHYTRNEQGDYVFAESLTPQQLLALALNFPVDEENPLG